MRNKKNGKREVKLRKRPNQKNPQNSRIGRIQETLIYQPIQLYHCQQLIKNVFSFFFHLVSRIFSLYFFSLSLSLYFFLSLPFSLFFLSVSLSPFLSISLSLSSSFSHYHKLSHILSSPHKFILFLTLFLFLSLNSSFSISLFFISSLSVLPPLNELVTLVFFTFFYRGFLRFVSRAFGRGRE